MKTLGMIITMFFGIAFLVLSLVMFIKEWKVNPWVPAIFGALLLFIAQEWTHGFIKTEVLRLLYSNAKSYSDKLNEFHGAVSAISDQMNKEQAIISKRISDIDAAMSILFDQQTTGIAFSNVINATFTSSDTNRLLFVKNDKDSTLCCFMLPSAAIKPSIRIRADNLPPITVFRTVANVTTAIINSKQDNLKNVTFTVTYISDINKTHIFERMTEDSNVFLTTSKTILITVDYQPHLYFTDLYE